MKKISDFSINFSKDEHLKIDRFFSLFSRLKKSTIIKSKFRIYIFSEHKNVLVFLFSEKKRSIGNKNDFAQYQRP